MDHNGGTGDSHQSGRDRSSDSSRTTSHNSLLPFEHVAPPGECGLSGGGSSGSHGRESLGKKREGRSMGCDGSQEALCESQGHVLSVTLVLRDSKKRKNAVNSGGFYCR